MSSCYRTRAAHHGVITNSGPSPGVPSTRMSNTTVDVGIGEDDVAIVYFGNSIRPPACSSANTIFSCAAGCLW